MQRSKFQNKAYEESLRKDQERAAQLVEEQNRLKMEEIWKEKEKLENEIQELERKKQEEQKKIEEEMKILVRFRQKKRKGADLWGVIRDLRGCMETCLADVFVLDVVWRCLTCNIGGSHEQLVQI
eukprot:TRINITY_DN462_c0_g1_i9.p2 TRINITY_DN462_c0_g1~~TRINITY_DN462_c0_g1_i9.p2  ORF type:complete len:125 (-),score=39.31 TRINITY_DN462_c0_g1_i9:210-584(-)